MAKIIPKTWERASEEQRQKMADKITEKGWSRLPEGHIAFDYRQKTSSKTSEPSFFDRHIQARNSESLDYINEKIEKRFSSYADMPGFADFFKQNGPDIPALRTKYKSENYEELQEKVKKEAHSRRLATEKKNLARMEGDGWTEETYAEAVEFNKGLDRDHFIDQVLTEVEWVYGSEITTIMRRHLCFIPEDLLQE